MRRLIYTFLIGLFFIGAAHNSQAQSNVIKINILSPVVKTASVFFEHALADNKSAQLGFFYTGASIGDTKFTGFGITPEFRFYLGETSAPQGFFFAPYLRYQNFTLTEDFTSSKATLSNIGGGLLIGKQWIFNERITVDAFLGPNYAKGDIKVESGSETAFETGVFNGFGIRLGLTVGLAF